MTITKEFSGGSSPIQLTPKDFKGLADPDWCAGCGNFGVLNALQRSCAEMNISPHSILTVSGIGAHRISQVILIPTACTHCTDVLSLLLQVQS